MAVVNIEEGSPEAEQVLWKFLGLKMIAYRREGDGQFVGTGLLNPLFDKLGLFTMLVSQARFYKKYTDLARWRGKRVANPFAPPVGSRPQLRAMKALLKKYLLGKVDPLAMTYAVTYRCQCNCGHCSAARFVRGDTPELSTDEAKDLIDASQDLGICILAFTGGEPLLRPDIFDLIAHVNQRKAMPILFSNGLLLTQENVERLVDAGLYTLFLSLDSPSAEEHDRLRGIPGLFDRAIEGALKLKSKGVLLGISSYASRTGTSRGDYRALYEVAQQIGAHTVLLFDDVPTGRQLTNTSEMLTDGQRAEILAYTREIFERKGVPSLSSQVWQNSIEGCLSGIGCLAGNIQYYVTAYGEVTPCDFTPLSFGNVRSSSLKQIWRGLVAHPAYRHASHICRMQHPDFRRCYVDAIPENASLPYCVGNLPCVDYRSQHAPRMERSSLLSKGV
ncbi:MAG: radical SAM protein [Spirochaetia bacterium]|jgi:MoaA/NifB/PqqE/SkfB family radical SAM enzyme